MQIHTGYPLSLPNSNEGVGGGWYCHIYPLTYEKLFWWHLVCHTFFSIKFAFHGYSRSLKVHHCPLDGRETETKIGKTEKHIGYQIWKTWLYLWQKQKNKIMLKNRKATNHNNHQKQKTKVFWAKTKTKTKTYLKIT